MGERLSFFCNNYLHPFRKRRSRDYRNVCLLHCPGTPPVAMTPYRMTGKKAGFFSADENPIHSIDSARSFSDDRQGGWRGDNTVVLWISSRREKRERKIRLFFQRELDGDTQVIVIEWFDNEAVRA
jgi:hypothetical protein